MNLAKVAPVEGDDLAQLRVEAEKIEAEKGRSGEEKKDGKEEKKKSKKDKDSKRKEEKDKGKDKGKKTSKRSASTEDSEVLNGKRPRTAATKSLSALFKGTGLDPREKYELECQGQPSEPSRKSRRRKVRRVPLPVLLRGGRGGSRQLFPSGHQSKDLGRISSRSPHTSNLTADEIGPPSGGGAGDSAKRSRSSGAAVLPNGVGSQRRRADDAGALHVVAWIPKDSLPLKKSGRPNEMPTASRK